MLTNRFVFLIHFAVIVFIRLCVLQVHTVRLAALPLCHAHWVSTVMATPCPPPRVTAAQDSSATEVRRCRTQHLAPPVITVCKAQQPRSPAYRELSQVCARLFSFLHCSENKSVISQ